MHQREGVARTWGTHGGLRGIDRKGCQGSQREVGRSWSEDALMVSRVPCQSAARVSGGADSPDGEAADTLGRRLPIDPRYSAESGTR